MRTEPFYPSVGRLVVAGDDGRWLAPPSLPPWSRHEILALAEPDPDRWSRGARARTWDVEPWPVPALREPHGSVYFAGEHLADPDLAGWTDGALQAGWTVAGRVARRLD